MRGLTGILGTIDRSRAEELLLDRELESAFLHNINSRICSGHSQLLPHLHKSVGKGDHLLSLDRQCSDVLHRFRIRAVGPLIVILRLFLSRLPKAVYVSTPARQVERCIPFPLCHGGPYRHWPASSSCFSCLRMTWCCSIECQLDLHHYPSSATSLTFPRSTPGYSSRSGRRNMAQSIPCGWVDVRQSLCPTQR